VQTGRIQLAATQRRHWQDAYDANPHMYGDHRSDPAAYAAGLFAGTGAGHVLELGAGHGRDTLFFAARGFTVTATDLSTVGLAQLMESAAGRGLTERVRTVVHDARDPLPLPDGSIDAVFAHMLLCMALSTEDLVNLTAEVARVLRPGGIFVYTVRHTGDAHYGTGTAHGDDIYEHGGFAVHFFTRELVADLANGWELQEIHPFEEGALPRRLWRVTQTRPA
jgi:SAM-dependent methyltransferase